jgi:hypothetical protein
VPVTSDRDALNRGIACLTMGDYAQGWKSFRNRFAGAPELRAGVAHLMGRYPTWTGEPLTGRLLLHSYGGAGDAFMLTRWVPTVRARVWDLTLEVSDSLVPFMAEQFEDVEVRAWGHHHQTGQHYDAWQESLPCPHSVAAGGRRIPHQRRTCAPRGPVIRCRAPTKWVSRVSHAPETAAQSRRLTVPLIQCASCGADVASEAVACPTCGQPLQKPPDDSLLGLFKQHPGLVGTVLYVLYDSLGQPLPDGAP